MEPVDHARTLMTVSLRTQRFPSSKLTALEITYAMSVPPGWSSVRAEAMSGLFSIYPSAQSQASDTQQVLRKYLMNE